jgi:glycosyltransferase involved in cell wall biosynthesis
MIGSTPGVEFEALFCCDHGVRASLDAEFGREIIMADGLTDGYPHRFLPNWSPSPGPTFFGNLNIEAWRIARGTDYDAVILHGYGRFTNLATLLSRGRRGPALLLRGDSNSLAQVGRLKGVVKASALRRLFSRVDRFLSIGTRNTEFYRLYGVPQSRISFAPYAVDNGWFEAGAGRARANLAETRERFGLPPNSTLFLFCGKLIPLKRVEDAIRALAAARKEVSCALVLAGQGALDASLRDLASSLGVLNAVRFLGFKNQAELPEIYGACDALVLPSDHEAWGLVVNEAMAAGLAIAVSDAVGSAVDLVDGSNGAVFRVGDVVGLSNLMVKWSRSPELLARLRAASRARIDKYGLRASVRGILEGVRQAVEDHQSRCV